MKPQSEVSKTRLLDLGRGAVKALVSTEDWAMVSAYEWTLKSNGYVIRRGDQMLLARFIMNCDQTMRVKFLDKNLLNCTRENLVVKRSEFYVPQKSVRKFL